MLALALGIAGAPAARAQSRRAAGGSGSGATETTTPSASAAPGVSSPADLQQRIDALKAELADLNTQLAAENDKEPAAAAADVPQDQGAPTPANPPQGATPATTAPAPTPLPSPSMTAPLATAIPHEVPAGPFGKIEVTGILSGLGWTEGNYAGYLGDTPTHYDISNAQVFVQKTTGVFQFYLQGGA
jgi:hypothetical protein